MSAPVVFNGSYADFKPVKTRSVWQVVIEIPAERAAEFVKLFGVPLPGQEQPVAVALLKTKASPGELPSQAPEQSTGQQRGEAGKPQSDKPKQHWSSMLRSKRAGIRCSDLKFQLWMSKRYPRADCDTAELVRRFCNVKSRDDLNEDRDAAERFDKLDAQFMMDTGQLAEVRS